MQDLDHDDVDGDQDEDDSEHQDWSAVMRAFFGYCERQHLTHKISYKLFLSLLYFTGNKQIGIMCGCL